MLVDLISSEALQIIGTIICQAVFGPLVRSPDKWAKYSLADDGTNDLKGLTADQVNKHAALQFLDEIKKRKCLEQSMSNSNDVDLQS